MKTDSNITVFNRRVNSSGQELLLPTVIKGCTWFYKHVISDKDFGDNNDEYSVRIPLNADTSGKTYVSPKRYENLEDKDVSKYWTLQKMDIVGRFECYDKGYDEVEIVSTHDDVFIVSTIADNTIRGSKSVKHWRVGGS